MKKLTIDFETRSAAPIRKVGAARYAEDRTTEAICLALKWQGEEPVIWYSPAFRGGLTLPTVSDDTVRSMIKTADVIEAHNAQFEYFIWKYVMPRYGFAMFDVKKLRCSAAKAATYGLPRSLEQACQVMKVRQQKDMEGSRLMMSLCRPRKALKAEMLADPSWESKLYWRGTPADFTRLGIYCMQDVRAEEDFSDSLPDLPEAEQRLWQLDLAINDRGVHVDAPATTAIVQCLETHSSALIRKFGQLTGGQVNSPRQREATLRHLIALGVQMDGLTANDVEAALASTENETARQILKIRQSLSKASTAKYKAFLESRNSDDRLRGMFMYHGAGTGRWTGKIVQPQNFPRGSFSDVDGAIRLFQAGDLEAIDLFYADPMVAAATCIRGMITPAEGHDFICADYSAIEGRVLAWLAGEEDALNVYREGRDPYKVAAAAIYHTTADAVDKSQRQVGKVAELACGYQGGVNAFNRMAENYGVELPESEVKSIVEKWRANRPETVRYWAELERACFAAVSKPGAVYKYRNVKFTVRNGFLAVKLPSGRCLYYANPRIEQKEMSWGGMKAVVSYEGVNSMTRKWVRSYLYGGLLAENITQATARDVLVNGLFQAETHDYPVVLHVHDEAVAEVPETAGSVEEFEKLLCTTPVWAAELPLEAEGWRGKRYKK